MKAALMRRLVPDLAGELVEIAELAKPEPVGPHDVVVRIAGAGVCRTELHILQGEIPVEVPHVLGHENAGLVEAVGSEVTAVREGEAVLCYPFISDGMSDPERDGLDQWAPDRVTPGIDAPGGFATHLLSHERAMVKLPEGIDPTDLAPLTDAGLAAYRACAKLDLGPGDTVVVFGAGGLGHLGIQILKAISPARVLAVDVKAEALALAMECGADAGLRPEELELDLGGHAPSAVLDFVGSDRTAAAGIGLLGFGGHYVAVGVGGEVRVPIFDLVGSEKKIEGVYVGSYRDLVEVTDLALSGKVVPRITRYPLEQTNQALSDLASGRITGRAVLAP
ncbi:MAG: alcohol dehydrogenase catalytic domain-containing protein [bacterium]|nr:alcohol dehydrogenase catalytic domain-containing protein [bacterium]MDE0601344.1 alcohol dehydrogenase catalytic domain-containing protein [bacterium]